ncbi:ADP-heptose--lipooligosaccharide heptosyltransferase II [hydrothermal vent metagenome]|uniref:ADP-heptose--lipooligosaccharide heptosyltransferase II n=1 Tax=hydrothermal vent metagenome TaxID=652676 RepID=A0A3B1BB15_9ZZZZ
MKLPLKTEPTNICILRLSAVGDVCHMLPIVRTIQKHWPNTEITWIIGQLEYSLVCDIPNIKFIIFDKSKGFSAYISLQRHLKNKSFDVLLHMQMSLRASIASLLVKAKIKLGFDRDSAKDLQWLFTNHKLHKPSSGHVIDNFFNFIETLGISERHLKWDIPLPPAALEFAKQQIPDSPIFVISPCSSMAYRNWNIASYAAIADYANAEYGFTIVLTGGPSEIEQYYGAKISKQANTKIINLISKTNLKQLSAILSRATVLLSPDSGPAHIATAVNLTVIGLYATTNAQRAQPYLSQKYTIDKYPEAILEKFNKKVSQLPWGTRVRDLGTMDRITIDDVKQKIDLFCADNNITKFKSV